MNLLNGGSLPSHCDSTSSLCLGLIALHTDSHPFYRANIKLGCSVAG